MDKNRLIRSLHESIGVDHELADQISRYICRHGDSDLLEVVRNSSHERPVVNEILLRVDMDALRDLLSSESSRRFDWTGPPGAMQERIGREMYLYLRDSLRSIYENAILDLDCSYEFCGPLDVGFYHRSPWHDIPVQKNFARLLISWWIEEGEEWYPYVMVDDISRSTENVSEIFYAQVTSVPVLDVAIDSVVDFLDHLRANV